MDTRDVVIIAAARTPFDRFGGVLKDVPSYQLGAVVAKELVSRAGIDKSEVDELSLGICVQLEAAQETNIIGRQVMLEAGLPPEAVSITLDRACCSSTAAIQYSERSLRLGISSLGLVCGVENMSRGGYLVPPGLRWEGTKMGDVVLRDPLFKLGYDRFNPVAVDAGEVALEYGVTREEQDDWAYRSQVRYQEALAAGKFSQEMFPVSFTRGRQTVTLDRDMQPRADITREMLSKLPTVYGSPTITPGNAPGLNTGGAGLALATGQRAKELGKEPLARVVKTVSVARNPREIAVVPAPAIMKCLREAGLKLEDIELIEINEAFAAMPLVSSKVLAEETGVSLKELRDKINVNGGAVAIGHPVGASGCRLVMTMMYELLRRGGGYGIAAICGGLAQGDAVLIKVG
ncbi:MAG: thiolase family protein [Firmicutes bacterium]|nr:thiolase family protein [Bacillota bacterium]